MASSCEALAAEIAALRAEIAKISRVDENRIVQTTRAALQPDISSAVAIGGTVVVNKLQPQIDNSIAKAREAFEKAFRAESTASNADKTANTAKKTADYSNQEAIAAKRKAEVAEVAANRAKYVASQADINAKNAVNSAGTATKVSNTAFDKAEFARKKAELAESGAFRAQNTSETARDAAKIASRESELAKGLANQSKTQAGQAFNKATQVEGSITNVARTANTALNTANDAQGAVGIVRSGLNKLGGTVDAFGRTLGKLEVAVGDALVKAAEAVGISKGALAATGKLAGQVVQIFNVIGTIFSILDGMATRELLGERIDAIEREVQAVGGDLSRLLGKLLGLQNRIGANETLTTQVKGIALDAKGIGEAANLKAGAAQITASRAEGFATTAIGKANQAQLTADGAVRNAAIANDNAITAYQKATESQATANKAQTLAEKAGSIAGQAFDKGVQALGVGLTALSLVQLLKLRPGIPGLKGERGAQGLPGSPGRDGVTAVIQLPGIPGRDGRNGLNGRNGLPGRDGKNGKDMGQAEVADLKVFIAAQHTKTQGILGSAIAGIKTSISSGLSTVASISSSAINGANAALLTIINNKLGNQVTGGISGLITSIAQNSYIDKAVGLLTLAATIHNALMLSNSIGQTLGGVINTVLGLILPKGLDGTPIDVFGTIGKTTEVLIESAVGADNYKKLKIEWALANRIYQATANVANALTNATQAITMGLEVIAGTTGKIGNALRAFGVVGERAYNFFNPQPNFQNKLFVSLENAQVAASTIEAVVQVPVSIVDAKKQFDDAEKEFKAAIKTDKNEDGTDRKKGVEVEEHKEEKDKNELGEVVSKGFEVIFEEIFDAGD